MFNERFTAEVNKLLEVSKGKEYINEEDVILRPISLASIFPSGRQICIRLVSTVGASPVVYEFIRKNKGLSERS